MELNEAHDVAFGVTWLVTLAFFAMGQSYVLQRAPHTELQLGLELELAQTFLRTQNIWRQRQLQLQLRLCSLYVLRAEKKVCASASCVCGAHK